MPGGYVRVRRLLLGVPAILLMVLPAACGKKPDQTSLPPPATEQPSQSTPATSAPVTQPTTPRRGSPVVTHDGPCPYFTTDFAEQTIGQHLARSTVVTTQPYHGCVLYRPDGSKAIEITVTIFLTPIAAQQKAVTVLGAGANPVRDIGERGTVLVGGDGTRLAAAKGRYLIRVWINQQSSLQAHDIAAKVAARVR
jgi:uncharacterized protein DUF2020